MTIIEFLRQYRVGPFAIFDFTASFIGILILSPLIIRFFKLFNIKFTVSALMWLTVPLSIVVHILIGTHTPLTKMFIDPSGYYLVKIAIIFMTYMGLRGVLF